MRLSRTDLLPVLTIVAGGILGASLSFSFIGSRANEVPVAVPLVVPSDAAPAPAGTVTGQVVDASSGQPIAAVQVFVPSLQLGGLTQPDGRYQLQNVPEGTYTLTAIRLGYRTTEVQITIGGGQAIEQNFSIAEEAIQLNGIVVTGTPGCTQASGSSINIRGFSSSQVGNQPLIYLDGVRLDYCYSQRRDLADLDPADIESIEVLKAPAAVALYGEEASAGAIQITLKEGRSDAEPGPGVSVRMERVEEVIDRAAPILRALTDGPIFTPMTVPPRISNFGEVQAALIEEYPPLLRDAGIEGTVVVWFFISDEGQVLDRRVGQSSGHTPLDEAALKIADVFRFTPGLNRNERVEVWVQLPITFEVQN